MTPHDTNFSNPDNDGATTHRSTRWWLWITVCMAVAGGSFALWRYYSPASAPTSAKGGVKAAAMPTPVFVASARKGDMNIYLTGLGSVSPLNNVTVRSRVDGQLMEVHYREGQNVTKGSLLATIDPRPFQVLLSQAEGQMARDREQLENAKADRERYRSLLKQDFIPRQQLDTQEALVRQYEGAIKIDQGQIDGAKLQLAYSRITAPISGRIGLRMVDPGNMVHATDAGGLLTIIQTQPIAVLFPLPEDNIPAVLRKMKGGQLPVEAFDREMKANLTTGQLVTLDNQIDPATGTVKLKAVFANRGMELFPNQFVNARLLLEVKKNATIVPSAAIQKSPQGAYAFVVKPDKTVAMRQVKTGPAQGGDTSITEGLEVGELVVVDGAERLRDGSKVEVKEREQGGKGGKDKRGTPPAGSGTDAKPRR